MSEQSEHPTEKTELLEKETDEFVKTVSTKCIVIALALIVSVLAVSFDIASISVGMLHLDDQCFDAKLLVGLSQWLVLCAAIKIILVGIITLCLISNILLPSKYTREYCSWYMMIASLIVYLAFVLVSTIYGIVELSYQFVLCKNEVSSVCVMAIIMTAVNMLVVITVGIGKTYHKIFPSK